MILACSGVITRRKEFPLIGTHFLLLHAKKQVYEAIITKSGRNERCATITKERIVQKVDS